MNNLCAKCRSSYLQSFQQDKPFGLMGWQCPVCGRGNSPYAVTCPCINPTVTFK